MHKRIKAGDRVYYRAPRIADRKKGSKPEFTVVEIYDGGTMANAGRLGCRCKAREILTRAASDNLSVHRHNGNAVLDTVQNIRVPEGSRTPLKDRQPGPYPR